jgi:hypothetical protein
MMSEDSGDAEDSGDDASTGTDQHDTTMAKNVPSANKAIKVFLANGLIPAAARSLFKLRRRTVGFSFRRYLVPFFAVFMPPSGRATASALLKKVAQLSALSTKVRGKSFLMIGAGAPG